jgi:hypothetical protein
MLWTPRVSWRGPRQMVEDGPGAHSLRRHGPVCRRPHTCTRGISLRCPLPGDVKAPSRPFASSALRWHLERRSTAAPASRVRLSRRAIGGAQRPLCGGGREPHWPPPQPPRPPARGRGALGAAPAALGRWAVGGSAAAERLMRFQRRRRVSQARASARLVRQPCDPQAGQGQAGWVGRLRGAVPGSLNRDRRAVRSAGPTAARALRSDTQAGGRGRGRLWAAAGRRGRRGAGWLGRPSRAGRQLHLGPRGRLEGRGQAAQARGGGYGRS